MNTDREEYSCLILTFFERLSYNEGGKIGVEDGEGGTVRKRPLLPGTHSKWSQQVGWTKAKPGARSFIRVFHVSESAQALAPSFAALPDATSRSWIRSRLGRTQTGTRNGFQHQGCSLTHYTTVSSLENTFEGICHNRVPSKTLKIQVHFRIN